jgi:hypothetical protein
MEQTRHRLSSAHRSHQTTALTLGMLHRPASVVPAKILKYMNLIKRTNRNHDPSRLHCCFSGTGRAGYSLEEGWLFLFFRFELVCTENGISLQIVITLTQSSSSPYAQ